MTYIQEIIQKLINRFKTNDPFILASHLNIHVHYFYLNEEINGFYKSEQRNRFIIINENLSYELKRFVCAHELGHAVLHPKINTPFMRKHTFFSTNKIESEANTFAVELLMPNCYLYDLKNRDITIYEAAELYGVPKDVCHLKNLKNNL